MINIYQKGGVWCEYVDIPVSILSASSLWWRHILVGPEKLCMWIIARTACDSLQWIHWSLKSERMITKVYVAIKVHFFCAELMLIKIIPASSKLSPWTWAWQSGCLKHEAAVLRQVALSCRQVGAHLWHRGPVVNRQQSDSNPGPTALAYLKQALSVINNWRNDNPNFIKNW